MEIPWEFLYERPSFLSQSIYTPVVRSLDLKNVRQPGKITSPLQILGMVSTPLGYEGLDVGEERRKLEQALSSLHDAGLVELRWLPSATMEELNRTISAPDDVHVLHYIGHGAYDQRRESGILILETARGDPYEISGEELGTLLYDEHSLRLAVLNSCEGARTSHVEPFSGVAARLVECGVPAVVGMQFEITDDAAITFSERFYTSLAQGFPVDAALAQARKAIFAAGSDIEFGTPVLFLRGADARLFDIEQGPPASAAAAAGPSDFSLCLEQRPVDPRPGEPVTWELTVENTGACQLRQISATSADGRVLAELADLGVGRRGVIRWRDTAEPDLRQLVTVTASDPEGSRISEQIVAHAGGPTEPLAANPPAAEDVRESPVEHRSDATQADSGGAETSTRERRGASRPRERPTKPRDGWSTGRSIALAAVVMVAIVAMVLASSKGGDDPKPRPTPSTVIDGGGTVDALAAGGDAVVWEREMPNGRFRLFAREREKTRPMPVPEAQNFAGVDVGNDDQGDLVAVYSRCSKQFHCDIYTKRLGTGPQRKAVEQRGCFLFAPSISAGVISFNRSRDASEPGRCSAGVGVKVRLKSPYAIPVSQPQDTSTDGSYVVWSTKPARELALAPVRSRVVTNRFRAPRGHTFTKPRLDGNYVYFVDSLNDATFFVARAKREGPQEYEHYGPSFKQAPRMAVTDGTLLYSGDATSNPDDGKDKIWLDRSPSFMRGLAEAP